MRGSPTGLTLETINTNNDTSLKSTPIPTAAVLVSMGSWGFYAPTVVDSNNIDQTDIINNGAVVCTSFKPHLISAYFISNKSDFLGIFLSGLEQQMPNLSEGLSKFFFRYWLIFFAIFLMYHKTHLGIIQAQKDTWFQEMN